jgi:hypothetical protein
MPSLYAENLDMRDWTAWREALAKLPEVLKAEAETIVGSEATAMASEVRRAYAETFEVHRGALSTNVHAVPLVGSSRGGGLRTVGWQVYNSWGTAHWFEFGTNIRVTRSQAVPAWRGRLRVAPRTVGGAIGGFTGEKATPRKLSSAVFRPIFIPLAVKHRRQMHERLAALLERNGFKVVLRAA